MMFQIAWKNIWRNKSRSLVVISSVFMGVWAGIFIVSFSWGLYKNNIDETVLNQLSHIQIHHPRFMEENDAGFTLKNTGEVLHKLRADARIASVSSRLITNGMITSPTNARGIKIYAINPDAEAKQIALNQRVREGAYFETGKSNEILIGKKLATKLKIKLKSKVIVTFTNINSEIVSGAFRVGGIYQTKNSSLDELYVYVRQDYIRGLLGLNPSESNEIAVLAKDENQINALKKTVETLIPNGDIKDWKELSPELGMVIESFNLYTTIITGIILLALSFGIINTMLMSVLERVRELGMLMAIGLNKRKIFLMIMLETIYITFIGAPIGLAVGWLSVTALGKTGIDISMFSEGLASYGFSAVIYPALDNQKYTIIVVMCLITAILSAIYPAYKALQLNPSEAIRKI